MPEAAVAEVTTAAPSTTDTSASGSAAATAQPSSAVTAPVENTRPKSMRESFERLEKKAEQSAATTATAATAQPATAQPASVGPVPLDVHTKALENARTKAVAEYRQRYGWAEKIPQEKLQEWGRTADRISTDPVGLAVDLIAEINRNPSLAPILQQRLGTGQQRTAQPAVTASLEPDVEIMDGSGRVVGKTFSAERVQAILKQGIAEALGAEVQPLKQDLQTRQEQQKRETVQRVTAERTAAIEKSADTIMAELEDILDGDKKLLPEVEKMWAQHPEWTAHKAALEVRNTIVKPRLKVQATEDATTEMKRKAAGNTANGAGASAMPKKPTNAKELANWMRERDRSA